MGYIDYSMSVNAAAAYDCGEKPLSKWTKLAIIRAAQDQLKNCELNEGEKFKRLNLLKAQNLQTLRGLLKYTASHHTSKMYNFTEFYSFDLDELTEQDINFEDFIKENKVETETKPTKETETVRYAMFKVGFFKSRKYLSWEKHVGKIQGGYAHFSFGRKLLSGSYLEEVGTATVKDWNLANPKPRTRISVLEKKKLFEASQQKYTFSEVAEAFLSKKFAKKIFHGEENEMSFFEILKKYSKIIDPSAKISAYYITCLLAEKAKAMDIRIHGYTQDYVVNFVNKTFCNIQK